VNQSSKGLELIALVEGLLAKGAGILQLNDKRHREQRGNDFLQLGQLDSYF
jgi:hypothetical protein